jgi:hypothetical protein
MGVMKLGELPAPIDVICLISQDLNNDGCDDLIMLRSSNQVTVWFGGDTVFTSIDALTLIVDIPGASIITAGNLDGNLGPDLAIGGLGGVQIFWNTGTLPTILPITELYPAFTRYERDWVGGRLFRHARDQWSRRRPGDNRQE